MSTINIPCPACGQSLKIRDRSLLGRKAKCPKCSHSFVLEEPAPVELQLAQPTTAIPTQATWIPDSPPATPAPPPVVVETGLPSVATSPAAGLPTPTSGVGRLREIRKQNSKRRWISLILGVLVVIGAGATGYVVFTQQQQAQQRIEVAEQAGQASAANGPATGTATGQSAMAFGLAASPTKGEPISLEMIPAGARTLLHLRPAELWTPGSPGEEFRYCLGPAGTFLEAQIQNICKRPPQDIEELLFAWIPGQRGTAPDLAVVVRLKEEAKKSDLLSMLGGQLVDTYGHPVYVDGERVSLIVNLKTYAIGPAFMAEEMVNAVGGQNPMPTGIEGLLEQTDRQRHMTLMFEPTAILLDAAFMAPESAQPFLKQCMDWFGDDAETVLWSLHLQSDRFYSDLVIRNTTLIAPHELERRMRERLDKLSKELLAAVRLMQPREQGKRQIIGRVPAMAKVFSIATLTDHGPRHVELITPLPDRAAPNLALGALLAWDESTRTDFNRQPPPSRSAEPSGLPATVAERLKKKIDVDFRRTPLQEALAYIGDETQVAFDIDGDALKLAGYTQNMPQTFAMEQAPALDTLHEILKQYDKMCIVLDEPRKTAVVLTYTVAQQKGLTPLAFEPKP